MSVIAAFCVPHPPLIVPEVGKGGENQVIKTIESYREVARRIAELKPETIVISSPHSVMYSDYFHISPGGSAKGSFASFHAPSVTFGEKYDTALILADGKPVADRFYDGTIWRVPAALLKDKETYLVMSELRDDISLA